MALDGKRIKSSSASFLFYFLFSTLWLINNICQNSLTQFLTMEALLVHTVVELVLNTDFF